MAAALRLGLIGAGRWGRNYIRTVASLPEVRLVRLASRNPDGAMPVPADCAIFADWRELLDPRALDGVIVATPPRLHAEMASRAIDAGLPVLVEKPLTMDVAEAHSLRDHARELGVFAMVDHVHLFSPAYRMLKSIQPRYGAIRAIHGEAGNYGPYRPDVPVLWDWGAHDVAMCLDLVGAMPTRTGATVLERKSLEGGIGETIRVELAFPNGAGASLRLSNLMQKCRRFAVACERASLVYDDLAAQKLVVTEGGSGRAIEIGDDLPLGIAVSEFAEAIAARSRDTTSLELGVRVVEVLAACAPAASSGSLLWPTGSG
ncbi:MAG: hypothetical protein A3H97_16540 [Acidobacteria bacterium RIFCSPLOWO2_02_FULL_65_29]|nr:MAG: hypothetical protein A3H97_16540 [Acidobacteria bacterium RIFCSPLOWO2_02_FULL_65_29]